MDSNALARLLDPLLRPIRQRISMMVSRAILESVKDDKGIQLVKVSLFHEETRENMERVQNFGFTSNPPKGSEAVAIFAGGNREHGFIIACDNRTFRFKNLAPGECAIYTDDGTHIVLKKEGEVEVKAATKLTVDVPDSTFKGNVKIEGALVVDETIDATGDITSSGNVIGGGTDLAAVKSTFNGHTHPYVDTPIGPSVTSPPSPPPL